MIPDSITLILFALTILAAPIWWGHTKEES